MDKVQSLTEWLILYKMDHGWLLGLTVNHTQNTKYYTLRRPPERREVDTRAVKSLQVRELISPVHKYSAHWQLTQKGRETYLAY